MKRLLLIACLLLPTIALADEPTKAELVEAVEAATKTVGRNLDAQIVEKTKRLALLRRERSDPEKKAANVAKWENEIALLEARRKAMAGGFACQWPAIEAFEVGAYGIVGRFDVNQVVNESTLLGEFTSYGANGRVTADALLRGFVTESVVDDDKLSIEKPLLVTGTESYTTVTGAKRTVYTVVPLPTKVVEAVEAEVKGRFEARAVEEKTAAMDAELAERQKLFEPREWRSADGKFTVVAKLLSLSDDGLSVTLEKEDGSRIVVPRTSLSGTDFGYLKKVAAADN